MSEHVDLVCLGDSIVYGYGVHPKYAWPKLAAEALKLNIINEGVNGDTSDGMNGRFHASVEIFQPEKVAVLAGANDILMGIPLSHTCETIELIIKKIRAIGSVPILIVPLMIDGEMLEKCWYSYFSIEDTVKLFAAYRRWMINYCKNEKIALIDFQKKYPEYMAQAGIKRGFQDGVHPTKEGYQLLGQIFCDVYKELFCE